MNHEMDPLDVQGIEDIQAVMQKEVSDAYALEVDDMKWLMSNKRGRRIVARLMDRAGVWRSSFNTNALQMSFNEGMRNDGLRLLDMVTAHCPERFVELLKECR